MLLQVSNLRTTGGKVRMRADLNIGNVVMLQASLITSSRPYTFLSTQRGRFHSLAVYYRKQNVTPILVREAQKTMLLALKGEQDLPYSNLPRDLELSWSLIDLKKSSAEKLLTVIRAVGSGGDWSFHIDFPIFGSEAIYTLIPSRYVGSKGARLTLRVMEGEVDMIREIAGAALLYASQEYSLPISKQMRPKKCVSCIFAKRDETLDWVERELYRVESSSPYNPESPWACTLKGHTIGGAMSRTMYETGVLVPMYALKPSIWDQVPQEIYEFYEGHLHSVFTVEELAERDAEMLREIERLESMSFEDLEDLAGVPTDPEPPERFWNTDQNMINAVVFDEGCFDHVGFGDPNTHVSYRLEKGFVFEKEEVVFLISF